MLLAEWNAMQQYRESQLSKKIPEMDLDLQLGKADHLAVAMNLPSGSVLLEFVYFNVFNFKAIRAQGESHGNRPSMPPLSSARESPKMFR